MVQFSICILLFFDGDANLLNFGKCRKTAILRNSLIILGTSREVGVNLKQGYNGDLTSKQAGSIGGQMVKKMIESYENSMK